MYGKPTENPPAYKSVSYPSRPSSMTADFCCIATSFVACLFSAYRTFAVTGVSAILGREQPIRQTSNMNTHVALRRAGVGHKRSVA